MVRPRPAAAILCPAAAILPLGRLWDPYGRGEPGVPATSVGGACKSYRGSRCRIRSRDLLSPPAASVRDFYEWELHGEPRFPYGIYRRLSVCSLLRRAARVGSLGRSPFPRGSLLPPWGVSGGASGIHGGCLLPFPVWDWDPYAGLLKAFYRACCGRFPCRCRCVAGCRWCTPMGESYLGLAPSRNL